MVTITIINDIRARIEGDFDAKKLDDLLSFRRSQFWWKSRAARAGRWDGKTHLYYEPTGIFPLGLRGMVVKWLKEQNIEYQIIDERTSRKIKPFKGIPDLEGVVLRPDQRKALFKMAKRERGIVHAATGSGKTELAIALVKKLKMPRTLFFTGRKKLARQTRERFATRLGVPLNSIGLIQGGKWEESVYGIYIAVVDSLTSAKFTKQRKDLFDHCELLIIDEAHHSPSNKWYQTIRYCKARRRYGLTGTPIGRSDSADLMLRACTGGVITRIRSRELIDKGILATPTVVFTQVDQPKLIGANDWHDVNQLGIVHNEYRNKIIADYTRQAEAADKRTLILVREIAQGDDLSELLNDCPFANGLEKDSRIDELLAEFEKGKFPTLIASGILGEGIDIPSINVLINASGGKSPIELIQKIGRGLRRKEHDNRVLVLDFFDTTNRYLIEHSALRKRICRKEGFKVVQLDDTGQIAKYLS